MPIVIFDGLTGKPVTALPPPGRTPSSGETATLLGQVIRRIRRRLPHGPIVVRGDSQYGNSAVIKPL